MTDDNAPPDKRAAARMTLQHLALFGRQYFMFRGLHDAPHLKDQAQHRPVMLVGTINEHYRQLQQLNQAGRGIFFQPNASDGKGFSRANISAAPCLFADFDKVPIDNLRRFPIPPHLIIETSPGKHHAYWRVEDIPLSRFSETQQRLADLFGSDPVVHDLPRIMRLAGFLHMKNPDAPHLVRIIEP